MSAEHLGELNSYGTNAFVPVNAVPSPSCSSKVQEARVAASANAWPALFLLEVGSFSSPQSQADTDLLKISLTA